MTAYADVVVVMLSITTMALAVSLMLIVSDDEADD